MSLMHVIEVLMSLKNHINWLTRQLSDPIAKIVYCIQFAYKSL